MEENSNKWKYLNPKYKIELYDDTMCEAFLLNEYGQLYSDIFQFLKDGPIKADFWRVCILYKYGGIYIDCDIHPLRDLDELFKKDYFFVTWHNDKKKLPYNAVIGSQKNQDIFLKIMKHSEESYHKVSKKKIYKTWKGRFVFQTTGHMMLNRVLKSEKINKKKYVLDILRIKSKSGKVVSGKNPYFEDSNASVWFKN